MKTGFKAPQAPVRSVSLGDTIVKPSKRKYKKGMVSYLTNRVVRRSKGRPDGMELYGPGAY